MADSGWTTHGHPREGSDEHAPDAGLLFAGGLVAGLGAGVTAIAHASDPVRPAQAWNEIFLPRRTESGAPGTANAGAADTVPDENGAERAELEA